MTHSFKNYEAPPLDEIFSPDFKESIMEYKCNIVSAGMTKYLLTTDINKTLFTGEDSIDANIDCLPMVAIGLVRDSYEAMQLFGEAMFNGLVAACKNGLDVPDGTENLSIQAKLDKKDPYKILFEMLISKE